MGATVRVNVELKHLEKVEARCYDCGQRFPITWQQYRAEKIVCPKCSGECQYDFFPDEKPSMHVSYSSVMELTRLCGTPSGSNEYHGEIDPDAVITNEKAVRTHKFGATFIEIAKAAKKARTNITWS